MLPFQVVASVTAPGAPASRSSSRSPSLQVNFTWTLAANGLYAGCQWGMLVVLAKLGSPEMVGQFALALAVTAPVIMLANLHLRAVQVTDVVEEFRFGDYLALRLVTTAISLLVIAAIAAGAGYRRATALVVLTIGFAKAVEAVSDVFYGRWQQCEQMDRIACSMLLKGPLSLAALTAGVFLTSEVFWGTLGVSVASILVLLRYDARAGAPYVDPTERADRRVRSRPAYWHVHAHASALLGLLRVAWPLGLVMMLVSLNANIPRYFVEHELGEAELGIYAALSYLATPGGLVVNALGQSASPRLARFYANGQVDSFRVLLTKLAGASLVLGAAAVLIAWVAGRELLALLYRPDYARHADILIWLLAVGSLSHVASVLGYGMTAARVFRAQLPLFSLAAAAAAASAYFLVPAWGLVGAAWASGVSVCVQLAGGVLCDALAVRRAGLRQSADRPTVALSGPMAS